MSTFSVLLAINVLMAVVALIRVRTATFIIVGNVCIMLRSLSSIEEFGQPWSMRYLPPALFDPARLETAANIFVIVTAVNVVAGLMPAAERTPVEPLPALPNLLLAAIGVYFVLFTAATRTIFSAAYAQESQEVFAIPMGGVASCLQGLLLYELYRRLKCGQFTLGRAYAILIGFLIVTEYVKGTTGVATGIVFVATFLFLGRTGSVVTRTLKIGAIVVTAALLALTIRISRGSLHAEGAGTLNATSEKLAGAEEGRSDKAEGIETFANGAEYASHVLECVFLYDSGYSREWRSLYLPIVYTFQPKPIMDLLGWERERDAPWELASHFIHGGGIAIFGEMYWNGGYPCVLITTALAAWLAYLGDTRRGRGFGWLIFHCMYAQVLLQGVGYGLAYLFRASFNALIVVFARRLFARLGADSAAHGRQVGTGGAEGVSRRAAAS